MNLDQIMMHQCIELAKKALGKTAPNPLVGSIIVKDGNIIGQGYHPEAGKPHAEIFALKEAGEAAAGATVYVNLEPCNHYGRTPPCTEALIAAKVAKVVVGMVDPNPLVGGNGIKKLQAAGIEVVTGIAESACRQLNEAFIHRIQHQKPFGILKYAITLDGKIAASTGHSAWVTSKASRHRVHQLRSACDGIIIGGNTVRKDNPNLTTHGVTDHNPLRIVMTRSCDLPESCNLWDTRIAPTLIFTKPDSNPQLQAKLLTKAVEIIHLEQVNPETVMNHLYKRGLSQVLWECGGILAANAISSQAVQKVMAFIAPKIIGGQTAPSPVGDMGLTEMTKALLLDRISLEKIEEDILIQGYLSKN